MSGYRRAPIVLGNTDYGRVFRVEIGYAGATYRQLVRTVRRQWNGRCSSDSWYASHSLGPWAYYQPTYQTATVYLPRPASVDHVRSVLYRIGWDIVRVSQRV